MRVKIGLMNKSDRDKYLSLENAAHNNLIKKGYLPQGINKNMTKVVVFKRENEHMPNEHTEVFCFDDWQEADSKLS